MMITDYLMATLRQPFEWGRSDCVMWATGWMDPDPMSDLRGAYETEREALRLMKGEGGMVQMFDSRMPRTTAKNGVCVVSIAGRMTAGILSAGVVLVKSDIGIIKPDVAPLGVWG